MISLFWRVGIGEVRGMSIRLSRFFNRGLLASIKLLFHLPYRHLEGFAMGLSRYVDMLAAPDYTTLDRRVNRLDEKGIEPT